MTFAGAAAVVALLATSASHYPQRFAQEVHQSDATIDPWERTITEPERLALEARRRVVRGEVRVDSRMWFHLRGTYHYRRTHVWFDGDAIRSDDQLLGRNHEKVAPELAPRDVRALFDSRQYYYSEDPARKRLTPGVYVRPYRPAKRGTVDNLAIWDPRLIGFAPTNTKSMVHYSLDSLVGLVPRRRTQVVDGGWNGWTCKFVRFEDRRQRMIEICIVPEMEHAVVALRIIKGISDTLVRMDHVQDAHSGLWFPKNGVYRITENGRPVRLEFMQVAVLALNQPIEPKTFDLAGMRIAPGTTVAHADRPDEAQYWNGTAVVDGRPRAQDGVVARAVATLGFLAEPGYLTAMSLFSLLIVAAAALRLGAHASEHPAPKLHAH